MRDPVRRRVRADEIGSLPRRVGEVRGNRARHHADDLDLGRRVDAQRLEQNAPAHRVRDDRYLPQIPAPGAHALEERHEPSGRQFAIRKVIAVTEDVEERQPRHHGDIARPLEADDGIGRAALVEQTGRRLEIFDHLRIDALRERSRVVVAVDEKKDMAMARDPTFVRVRERLRGIDDAIIVGHVAASVGVRRPDREHVEPRLHHGFRKLCRPLMRSLTTGDR